MIDLSPWRNLPRQRNRPNKIRIERLCPGLGVASRGARVLAPLVAGLVLMPGGPLTAQTFTTLHSFTARSADSSGVDTNSDGTAPQPGLLLSGSIPYGTAEFGGSSGNGTVFAVKTDGTGFTNLHSFTATSSNDYTNGDGASPAAGLILSGNTLFGTAYNGGSSGNGTVFAVKTDGTGFTNLHSFTATDPVTGSNTDGAGPQAPLVLSGNTLYGTTGEGAAVMVRARCSRSTRMARVLPTCTVSRHPLALILPTGTELFRLLA